MTPIKVFMVFSVLGALFTTGCGQDLFEDYSLRDRDDELRITPRLKNPEKISTRKQKGSSSAGGVVFIHWGSQACTKKSTKIYSGHVSVTHYVSASTAAHYLCLAEVEKGGKADLQSEAHLYGVVYDVNNMTTKSAFCAACFIAKSSSYHTIHGSTECPDGLKSQYDGYLMAGTNNYPAAAEYICVDKNIEGSSTDPEEEGGRLQFVDGPLNGGRRDKTRTADNAVKCVVCSS